MATKAVIENVRFEFRVVTGREPWIIEYADGGVRYYDTMDEACADNMLMAYVLGMRGTVKRNPRAGNEVTN